MTTRIELTRERGWEMVVRAGIRKVEIFPAGDAIHLIGGQVLMYWHEGNDYGDYFTIEEA